MKTYCKDVDITDREFIRAAFRDFASGKKTRRDMRDFFAENDEDDVIEEVRRAIITRTVEVGDITYFRRIEPINGKERTIGRETPMHQLYDYVAVHGLMALFCAKIGFYQCASLPGKGQALAHRSIKRWVREGKARYFVKIDVRKYYPSIDAEVLMSMLRRDVRNDDLLYLVEYLIGRFDAGLSIGSFLSQYLANYYLSYAYHHATERLEKVRLNKRTGVVTRKRLIDHCLFYMDDVLLMGHDKRDLKMAVRQLVKYMADCLHLEVKPWKVCVVGKEPIDMVGFVFYPHKTVIRAAIFVRARRAFARTRKMDRITLRAAYRCIAYWGYFKHSDTKRFVAANDIKDTFERCKDVVSLAANERVLNESLFTRAA